MTESDQYDHAHVARIRDKRIDGRTARAERTREMLLVGLGDCLREGHTAPTAEQISAHAGVSLRTLFRLFDHVEDLLLAFDIHEHVRLAARFRSCPLDAPLKRRVDSFWDNGARLYEATSPIRRALLRYEGRFAALDTYRDRQRRITRKKIQTVFVPELERLSLSASRDVISQVTALTSWAFWEELRHHQGLSASRARALVKKGLMDSLAVGRDAVGG